MRYFNIVILFIWQFAFICVAETQVLRIGAGGVPLNNIFLIIQKPFELATGIKMELKKTEPHTALIGLDKNEYDAVAIGLTFKDWLIQAKNKGYEAVDEKKYFQKVIAKNTLLFITSLDTKIVKLKFEQIYDIFNGKIKNWNEVGGANIPITFIKALDGPGVNERVRKNILGNGEFKVSKSKEVLFSDIEKTIVATPGAIAFGPKSFIKNPKLQAVDVDMDLSTSVTVLTKGDPKPEVKKLLDFIATEGSKYIIE